VRIVASIFFCFLVTASYAQQDSTLKGRWMIGGNGEMYIERINNEPQNLFTISVEPQAGYFFAKSFAAGLRLPFGFSVNSFQVTLLPFAAYYLPLKGNIKPFIELNTGVAWDNNIDEVSYEVDYKQTAWLAGGRTGAAFFIKQNISLDLFLYYKNKRNKWRDLDPDAIQLEGVTTLKKFGIGAGFQIYL